MLFDDRLATVLRLSATSEAGQRTQYRQLLDLMGNRPLPLHAHEGYREQSLLAAAWLRMDALADAIAADERARIIREPSWRLRSTELVGYLAQQEPAVASAALQRAELSTEQWIALIPELPIRARGFLRLRRDLPLNAEAVLDRLGVHDRGLPAPPPHETPEPAPTPAPAPARLHSPTTLRAVHPEPESPSVPQRDLESGRDRTANERNEISALVERIAQFRRERSDIAEEIDLSPRLPLGEMPETSSRIAQAFGFVADASGRIEWASDEYAPMLIGTRLLRPVALGLTGAQAPSAKLIRAFGQRQPVSGAIIWLAGAPAIAGEWIVDAEPQFTAEGHFSGYLGRFRRPPATSPETTPVASQEADRIRQLLHELRTPVTAVQGYAEVIQQQLFGPAPHEYRALAAAIAADAAHILAGFEELDRLARLETGALAITPGEVDLAGLMRRMATQLTAVLATKGASLTLGEDRGESLLAALDEDEAEALLWRLMATLAGNCQPGEHLAIRLIPVFDGPAAMAQITCELPARLIAADDLFASEIRPADHTITAGLFGAGFALRLARAEAVRAGGALMPDKDHLIIRLPLITGAETNPKAVAGHNPA